MPKKGVEIRALDVIDIHWLNGKEVQWHYGNRRETSSSLLSVDYLEFSSQQGEVTQMIYKGNPQHGENTVAKWLWCRILLFMSEAWFAVEFKISSQNKLLPYKFKCSNGRQRRFRIDKNWWGRPPLFASLILFGLIQRVYIRTWILSFRLRWMLTCLFRIRSYSSL